MSATRSEPRRSVVMKVLRVSPVPIVLTFVAGVALMGVSSGPSADEMM